MACTVAGRAGCRRPIAPAAFEPRPDRLRTRGAYSVGTRCASGVGGSQDSSWPTTGHDRVVVARLIIVAFSHRPMANRNDSVVLWWSNHFRTTSGPSTWP